MRELLTRPNSVWVLRLVSGLVMISGLLTVGSILLAQARLRSGAPVVTTDAHFTLIAGTAMIYLATLLRRAKYNAWLISLPIYVFIIIRNIRHFYFDWSPNAHLLPVILNLLVPATALLVLIVYRPLFRVRSETRRVALSLRRSALVLLVAFIFGVVGFQFMDEKDFYQEISIPQAAHYTIDQFGLTTARPLIAHTHRAKLFLDSLAAVSLTAAGFVMISFFAPIRFRLHSQEAERIELEQLLKKYRGSSEDFFKLWPQDKAYFLSSDRRAGLAYKTVGNVALVVGDPAGNPGSFSDLIQAFDQYCRVNDWNISFVHVEPDSKSILRKFGFELQLIGEEAIVETSKFVDRVLPTKYFREINNRFIKQGFRCEVLAPPHSRAVLNRLKEISDDWLKIPGRSERGFMMGYFDPRYLEKCEVVVVRDDAQTIQAFLNRIPSFNPSEANYDLLRHSSSSPGNINDFLLMNFIGLLAEDGTKTLNMGLAPLVGVGKNKSDKNRIDTVLKFIYESGDRFYSFKGLARFKEKYEPTWQARYAAYRGGVRGLSRTLNAQLRAMRVHKTS